ncbi:MAG: hypothetical protein ACFCVF_06395 [Kineosporiaceae bacterium]
MNQPTAVSVPRVEVLGRVRVVGARGTVPAAGRTRVCEFAAFLALYRDLGPDLLSSSMRRDALPVRGDGVDLHTVDLALFDSTPGTRGTSVGISRVRIARLAGALRAWLGWHPTTKDLYLPPYTEDCGFRLHPAITTDWAHWGRLLPNGPAAAGTADLEAAWSLVRGSLMQAGGREYTSYNWADDLLMGMQDEVDTAAVELSRRRRRAGNLVAAARAAGHGIRVNYCAEDPWRQLILTVQDALSVLHTTPGSLHHVVDTRDDNEDDTSEASGATRGETSPASPPGYAAQDWAEHQADADYDRQLESRRRTHGPLDAVVWAMLETQSEIGFHSRPQGIDDREGAVRE